MITIFSVKFYLACCHAFLNLLAGPYLPFVGFVNSLRPCGTQKCYLRARNTI